MTYGEAIDWLLSFADFERSGRFQDRPDVAPMLALLERLGNPHLGRKTVHIAGSKGKGSVTTMLGYVLDAEGVTTGLYSSPHLYQYTERIKMDGVDIDEDRIAIMVEDYLRPAVESLSASLSNRRLVTFDLLTALAFLEFRRWGVEVQVIEVGLGGRVDSTNVFERKEVAVITPISLEHTAILGNTVEAIAREKAGIITSSCAVILSPQSHPEVGRVVSNRATDLGSRVVTVAEEYRWRKLSHDLSGQRIRIEGERGVVETDLPLLGSHQIENAATAAAAAYALDEDLDPSTVSTGLGDMVWPCRIEVAREDPLVIVDGAHNRDSARRLAETLVEYFACERAVFVIGCGSDKDIDGLAEELAPLATRVIAVRADHPRAMNPQRVAEAFGRLNVECEIVDNVPNGVDRALAATSDGRFTLICVAGSLFVAAEARAHLLGVRT